LTFFIFYAILYIELIDLYKNIFKGGTQNEYKKSKASSSSSGNSDINRRVDESISKIARMQGKSTRPPSDTLTGLSQFRQKRKKRFTPLKKQVETTFAGIYAYCEANRPELTKDGKKNHRALIRNALLEVQSSVSRIKSGLKVAQVVRHSEASWSCRFIRIKREINKEAILDSLLQLLESGISIVQEETSMLNRKNT